MIASIIWYSIEQLQNPTATKLIQILEKSTKELEEYKKTNNQYPNEIDCSPSPAKSTICFVAPSGFKFVYQSDNENDPKTFSLHLDSQALKYRATTNESPRKVNLVCPLGFINVPGSRIYNTSDFCVMKYEAKTRSFGYGSGSSGLPAVNISQQEAIKLAKNVCQGCQLISEAQWLTIARDVLMVASNWSGGSIGSGYIYSGHSDQDPNTPLEASINDDDGLFMTNSTNSQQRRTLTLTNGEIIWDLAGNVYELTANLITGDQPGQDTIGYKISQWPEVKLAGTTEVSPLPKTTGLQNADKWTAENGIGVLYSNTKETQTKAILRGGGWNDGTNKPSFSGVMTMLLMLSPNIQATNVGFRVTK